MNVRSQACENSVAHFLEHSFQKSHALARLRLYRHSVRTFPPTPDDIFSSGTNEALVRVGPVASILTTTTRRSTIPSLSPEAPRTKKLSHVFERS